MKRKNPNPTPVRPKIKPASYPSKEKLQSFVALATKIYTR